MSADKRYRDPKNTANLQRSASYASLSVALLLVGAKIWAWSETGSVSLLSSLVDSFLDVMASAITVIGVGISLRPADRRHRFGHGKAQGLAALAQSLIITLSAGFVMYEAGHRLTEPQPVTAPETGVLVMALSIVLTTALLMYQRRVIRHTGSVAISADAVHYRSDLLINLSVAIAIPLAAFGQFSIIDPIIGLAIALYILWNTYEIAQKALGILLDRELSDKARRRIREIAERHPNVKGFHDLRTRSGGTHYIIQFHLELDPDTTLTNAHVILDDVEDEIRREFPQCEIIIHPDPLGFDERRDSFD